MLLNVVLLHLSFSSFVCQAISENSHTMNFQRYVYIYIPLKKKNNLHFFYWTRKMWCKYNGRVNDKKSENREEKNYTFEENNTLLSSVQCRQDYNKTSSVAV